MIETATPASQTVLRIAMTLCTLDPHSLLTDAQRTWIRARLKRVDASGMAVVLTAHEVQKITPVVLAWADSVGAHAGDTLRNSFSRKEGV